MQGCCGDGRRPWEKLAGVKTQRNLRFRVFGHTKRIVSRRIRSDMPHASPDRVVAGCACGAVPIAVVRVVDDVV